MWIKRRNIIINTDNVCAIRQEGNKLIFRLHGSSAPSTIEHAPPPNPKSCWKAFLKVQYKSSGREYLIEKNV